MLILVLRDCGGGCCARRSMSCMIMRISGVNAVKSSSRSRTGTCCLDTSGPKSKSSKRQLRVFVCRRGGLFGVPLHEFCRPIDGSIFSRAAGSFNDVVGDNVILVSDDLFSLLLLTGLPSCGVSVPVRLPPLNILSVPSSSSSHAPASSFSKLSSPPSPPPDAPYECCEEERWA